MQQAIEIQVSGLKWDAEGCDYYDHEAKYEDYESYVNKPCPKCGSNLLTEADMRACKLIEAATAIVNAAHPAPIEGEEIARVRMHMDGSGIVKPELLTTKTD